MIPMGFVRHCRLCRAWPLAVALAALPACQEQKDKPIRGDRSVRPLDGMERFAARSVSIETAIAAMQDRDVKKLKMLSVWVKKRDKTVLLSADDVSSLDLAIQCLEGQLSQDERSDALDNIKSGKLKAAAREVCLEDED